MEVAVIVITLESEPLGIDWMFPDCTIAARRRVETALRMCFMMDIEKRTLDPIQMSDFLERKDRTEVDGIRSEDRVDVGLVFNILKAVLVSYCLLCSFTSLP